MTTEEVRATQILTNTTKPGLELNFYAIYRAIANQYFATVPGGLTHLFLIVNVIAMSASSTLIIIRRRPTRITSECVLGRIPACDEWARRDMSERFRLFRVRFGGSGE